MDAIFSEKKGSKKQCDGYIVLKYMGITKKTKIVKILSAIDKKIKLNNKINNKITNENQVIFSIGDQDKEYLHLFF